MHRCEGQDDQEDCVENGMYRVQVPQTASNQALQTLRTWWRQEEEGKQSQFELLPEPAVFRSTWIFTPCCGLCLLPWNLLLAAEKHGIARFCNIYV